MQERDFREAIETFLLTGYRFHKDIITVILQQLKKLHAAIGQLPTYRFYACSLLIVYDGDFENDISLTGSDLLPGAECGSAGEGMRTANGTFEAKALGHNGEVLGDSHADGDSPTLTPCNPEGDAASVADVRHDDASGHVNLSTCVAETRLCEPDAAGERNASSASSKGFRSAADGSMSEGLTTTTTTKHRIDVRMVDFAHSTFKGFGSDVVVHEGVDRGCLLGLETLIKIVSEMKLSAI